MTWLINVFDLTYASIDVEDSVNGIMYHEEKPEFTGDERYDQEEE